MSAWIEKNPDASPNLAYEAGWDKAIGYAQQEIDQLAEQRKELLEVLEKVSNRHPGPNGIGDVVRAVLARHNKEKP